MRRTYWFPCWLLTVSACAAGPAVRGDKDLPIRNVVLYRSGVGYFERQGSFEGDALAFTVKKREVGDFLSSLTAVEHSAGGVRSISFDVPESAPEQPCAEDQQPCPKRPDLEEQPVKVKLMLAGAERHDLDVSYVVGSPIWRPSYRVVFDDSDKALLQAWAVVQNTSGEDWRNVRLSLTTGAPISFRSDLGTPITPERPIVTDTGEVLSAVPTGDTALAQEPPPPPMAAAPAPMEREEADEDAAMYEVMPSVEAKKSMPSRSRGGAAGGSAMPQAKPAAPRPTMQAAQLEQSVAAQATAQALSGAVTRYDIAQPVTIPNNGSTMVALLSTRVAGEKAHLFAPEPGVALSYQHPFSAARLVNQTAAVLEKGPVSVLANGAFLGQGVLDTLPKDASAFLPFALDKSLVVETSEHWDQAAGALLRIQRGVVTLQTFSQRKTRYKVRNGSDEPAKVYVRHARWSNAELVTPPEGTELAAQRALVPIAVGKKGQGELEVVERTPVETSLSIIDAQAADAVALYLSGPAVDAAHSDALKQALSLRKDLLSAYEQLAAMEREQAELQRSASETRDNLKAIEKVKTAADLRARLVTRLKQLDARLGELTQKLVEARTRKSELEVRLNEALEDVSLSVR